jgi:hypothetical protein
MEYEVFIDVMLLCNGKQVIGTSGAITNHMQQCAAIAEIELGGNVENSLFDAADGDSHVKSTVVLFNGDPWVDVVRKEGGKEGEKLCPMCNKAHMEEEGEKERRGKKNKEEGMGRECEDRGTDVESVCAASAALLSLDASKCRRGEGRV